MSFQISVFPAMLDMHNTFCKFQPLQTLRYVTNASELLGDAQCVDIQLTRNVPSEMMG